MELSLDTTLASQYTSPSQQARRLTEGWVERESYCPNCGCIPILKYPNSKPVADFACPDCGEDYELKSSKKPTMNRVVDGEYDTMIRRLRDSHNPNLLLLSYNRTEMSVCSFMVIPKHFFVPDIIEKRPPLSRAAERADWVGCNILLHKVPQSGRIFLIKNGREEPKNRVLEEWRRTLFLRQEKNVGERSWLLDVMRCVENLKTNEFSLETLYGCEEHLQVEHPQNKHIRAKIRQQLQVLRDQGFLEFLGRGRYRIRD